MMYPVIKELDNSLDSRKHIKLLKPRMRREVCEESFVLGQNKRQRHEFGRSKFGVYEDMELGGDISNIRQYMLDSQLGNLEQKERSISEETSISRKETESEEAGSKNSTKQNFQLMKKVSGELKVIEQEGTDAVDDQQKCMYLHPVTLGKKQKTQTLIDFLHSFDSYDEAKHFANSFPYKSGDKMMTIPPADIW